MTGKISFYTWLLQYVKDDTALGDLARDSKRDNKYYGSLYDDSGFPRHSRDKKKIRNHLSVSRDANSNCLAVFDSAFIQYRDFMKKRGFDV